MSSTKKATRKEPTQVGLSDAGHGKLAKLKEDGHFGEMQQAYRFAVSLALAHGATGSDLVEGRQTIFSVATLDSDRALYHAVAALRDEVDEPVYHTLQRLAEWGVEELYRRVEEGNLDLAEILQEAVSLTDN